MPAVRLPFEYVDHERRRDRLRGISLAAKGAYFELHRELWVTGEPIADDIMLLAEVTRTDHVRFRQVKPELERLFLIHQGHWWLDLDTQALRDKAALKALRQSEGGRKGAAGRWPKGGGSPNGSPNGLAIGLPNGSADGIADGDKDKDKNRTPLPPRTPGSARAADHATASEPQGLAVARPSRSAMAAEIAALAPARLGEDAPPSQAEREAEAIAFIERERAAK